MTPIVLTDAVASELNAEGMHGPRLVVFATHGKFLHEGPSTRLLFTRLEFGPEGTKVEGLSKEQLLASDPLFMSMLVLASQPLALR